MFIGYSKDQASIVHHDWVKIVGHCENLEGLVATEKMKFKETQWEILCLDFKNRPVYRKKYASV